MSPAYIIVQAGGKGTRLGQLTQNKPKALVPVENRPMLFHLFEKYPDSVFIVIGDYKADVLERYLRAFAKVKYSVVRASGHTGTCAGISEALTHLPAKTPFLLIWSDLVLPERFELPELQGDMVGLSQGFRCRWRYENDRFEEIPSEYSGVAGLFLFTEKRKIENVPTDGEFVRWLQGQEMKFHELLLPQTNEYGLLEEYNKLAQPKCRPFNQIEILDDRVVKRPIDDQGKTLGKREALWYSAVKDMGFRNVPIVYSVEPLTLERVKGGNIYDCTTLSYEQKRNVLRDILCCLEEVHQLGTQPVNRESVYEAYVKKTYDRLEKVRDLVPFATEETVVVNGKRCRNVFFHREEIERQVEEAMPAEFCFIHGDCTFSNMMLREDLSPVLIDPRGYFGHTELYGDADYDWAKLYYSLVGNYDQFNLKRFSLEIRDDGVELRVESNGWQMLEKDFFELLGNKVNEKKIKLLHALIWLSLSTYAWENYDSICGAFYNGLWYLEDVL